MPMDDCNAESIKAQRFTHSHRKGTVLPVTSPHVIFVTSAVCCITADCPWSGLAWMGRKAYVDRLDVALRATHQGHSKLCHPRVASVYAAARSDFICRS